MTHARLAALVVAALVLAACGDVVDPPPLGDYTTWKKLVVDGPAPGHGNSVRIIYANDIAADPLHDFVGGYAAGSVIVKEIHDHDDGVITGLRYTAIMRRDDAWAHEGGWLFTQIRDAGDDELHQALCWNRCHVAAPYAGAWYDYRFTPSQ